MPPPQQQEPFSKDLRQVLERAYPGEGERILEALRKPPTRYYVRANTIKSSSDLVVEALRGHGLDAKRHAIVGEAVSVPVEEGPQLAPRVKRIIAKKEAAEAVMIGSNLYAPGVRRCQGIRRGDFVSVVDELGQIAGEGLAIQGEQEILAKRRGLSIDVVNSRYRTAKFLEMPEFLEGAFYPQGLPAMLACRILDPRPGETVLDICASPGGKTGAIAQMMGNTGNIIAIDRNSKKVERLERNLRRLGVTNATCITHDARYLARDGIVRDADRAIVDPPCTAIGLRPKLYHQLREKDVSDLSSLQLQILSEAIKCVKAGGRVVYTTCTISREEDEGVVLSALSALPEIEVEEVVIPIGDLEALGGGKVVRFNPVRQEDCPGYFIASLASK
jgi:16S rRNA (cytosine967-C5)-methyltransferase